MKDIDLEGVKLAPGETVIYKIYGLQIFYMSNDNGQLHAKVAELIA